MTDRASQLLKRNSSTAPTGLRSNYYKNKKKSLLQTNSA